MLKSWCRRRQGYFCISFSSVIHFAVLVISLPRIRCDLIVGDIASRLSAWLMTLDGVSMRRQGDHISYIVPNVVDLSVRDSLPDRIRSTTLEVVSSD
nr:hypothetical protein CFP56_03197 [Quercus suber]